MQKITIKKGHNINISGLASREFSNAPTQKFVSISPQDFNYIKPKLLVKEGDQVSLGDALFFDDPCSGKKFYGAYGSSKSAQISLAQSWANECKTFGPNVTVFRPSPMKTALRARFFPGENKENLLSPKIEAQRVLATLFDR